MAQSDDNPQVDVLARPSGDTLAAPTTNPALQLAASLSDTNESLTPMLGQLATHFKAQAEARAFKDALSNSGQAFADAVKSGRIAPTQNPWYIQAYERNAAQLRSQAQVSALVADSQSWAEKNDPQAFAQKFNTQLGQIAQHYDGINQVAGFQKSAQPLADQALSSNVQYNVQRIQQEHVQDTTSLATQAVMNTLKATPGATPEQIFQSMEEQHKLWLGVGGDESQWRLVVRQAVVGAGANMGDSGVLDILKAPYLGGEPIANQADETGKPVGLEVSSDKFWIDRGVDASLNQAYKARQAAIAGEGAKVDDWAAQTYGNDYAFGRIPLSQLEADGVAHGFSAQAIMWAADKQGDALRGAAGYSQGQTDIYSSDPAVQQRILAVNHEALTGGLTPRLTSELSDMVGRQQITKDMALAVMDRASGQSHYAVGLAHADANAARSNAIAAGSLAIQRYSIVANEAKGVKAQGGDALRNLGFDPAKLPPKTFKSFESAVDDAALAVAEKGPGAAHDAAGAAATRWISTYAASHRKNPGAPAVGLVNPNR